MSKREQADREIPCYSVETNGGDVIFVSADDRYDEERKEWEAKVIALETGINSAIEQVRIARSQVTALTEERDAALRAYEDANQQLFRAQARADRAEKERDEAIEWRREVAEALDCIRDNGEIGDAEYVTKHARSLRHFADGRHYALKERDEAFARCRAGLSTKEPAADCAEWVERVSLGIGIHYYYDGPFVAAESDVVIEDIKKLREERDRAIAERDEAREAWGRAESDACEWEEKAGVASADLATFTEKLHKAEQERDDLGCQLEALRAVQRGDVADLRARMEAVEKWRAECESVPAHDDPYRGPGDEREALSDDEDDPDAGLEGLAFPPKGGSR